MVEASLGLGGNIGDVAGSFIDALRRLSQAPGVSLRRASAIYRTPPWGKLDQPSFLNMAALVETNLSARALLALCLEIEQKMGRRRLERWGPRTLDIDILTYGELENRRARLEGAASANRGTRVRARAVGGNCSPFPNCRSGNFSVARARGSCGRRSRADGDPQIARRPGFGQRKTIGWPRGCLSRRPMTN